MFRTADFHYDLPAELIAQVPADRRDASRLLLLKRPDGAIEHRSFREFPSFLRSGDLLVLNNSKVLPARLRAIKPETGGSVEILLVEELTTNEWWAMLKPGKRVRAGTLLQLLSRNLQRTTFNAEVLEKSEEGHYRLRFSGSNDITGELTGIGEIPLPPYIQRPEGARESDATRYQTVFSSTPGSVAAPTAGLHFTDEILNEVRLRGIEIAEVTLHVGLGTFAPVKAVTLEQHRMHEERYQVSAEAASAINAAKSAGRRVVAVGTTSLRVLESAAVAPGEIAAGSGKTRLFVYPPYRFKVVDALLTNFHLPGSTLLMLVSAFAAPEETRGREIVLNAYAEAIRERYRFFSYGDAMFIV